MGVRLWVSPAMAKLCFFNFFGKSTAGAVSPSNARRLHRGGGGGMDGCDGSNHFQGNRGMA